MTEDLLLNQRKIRNYLRKFSSTIGDENNLRKLLLKLFYYDIDGIPISVIKKEEDIDWNNFPQIFKLLRKEDIIDIYNKEVKTNYFKELKILDEKELDIYDITENNLLEISLKTFRPVYLKHQYFPDFNVFIKYIYYKYQIPIHKDIKIIFDNIENSYKDVKEYIKINDLNFNNVKDIIIKSTNIQNRILMEK